MSNVIENPVALEALMEKIDAIKEFIGKTVIIRYNLPNGQIFRYEGIVLEITEVSIVLDDFKEGQMMLPLANCQMKEVKHG